jgi:octopine/nopaline transport system substrate-binding protein
MKLIYAAGFVLLVSFSQSVAGDRMSIVIASEGASPPWDFVTGSGELKGFDIDVGRELCRRAKLECKFVTQDWDGIIPALTVGKYDAIISGMAITEKRKKSISFSEPYAGGFNQIVVRRDLDLPSTNTSKRVDLTIIDAEKQKILDQLKDTLKGKTLGVLRSSNSEVVLNQLVGSTATIRSYDSLDNLHLDLVAGRIDGGLADYFTWKTFLESKDGERSILYGPELSGGSWGPGVGVGLRQADTKLVTAFNRAIDAAKIDGTLKRLSLQWFGLDVSPSP